MELLTRLERGLQAEFYGEGDEAELAAAIAELREHPVTAETLEEARRWAGMRWMRWLRSPRAP